MATVDELRAEGIYQVLTPDECAEFRTDPADPAIQDDLNDGSLDQDTFVEINP